MFSLFIPSMCMDLYLSYKLDRYILLTLVGLSGRDRMVVGFIPTYAISAYHH